MSLPHNLKSPADIARPEDVGVCDRCSQIRFYRDLEKQFQYSGNDLTYTGLIVCRDRCLDTPSEFLRPPIFGPEGLGPKDPRPTSYGTQNQGGVAAPDNIAQFVEGD